jgi:hypothetical protein
MARTYKRDSNGRFAGGGGSSGGKKGGGTKPLQRGANRLTRDNAGRITSVGGSGATAYGGRIRTASGKKRATVTARGIGKAPAGTVGKPRGLKPGTMKARAVAANPAARVAMAKSTATPAKKPPMTRAEYEAAAKKAWGVVPSAPRRKAKQSTDQQLDRLEQRAFNSTKSGYGLSKAEAMKAQDLAKKTGRSIRVRENPKGGYSIEVERRK